jgi:hypothetical protein
VEGLAHLVAEQLRCRRHNEQGGQRSEGQEQVALAKIEDWGHRV